MAQKPTFQLGRAVQPDIKFPATNDAAKGGEVFVDGVPSGTVPVLVNPPPGRPLGRGENRPGQKGLYRDRRGKGGRDAGGGVTMQADQRVGSLLIAADVTADVLVPMMASRAARRRSWSITSGDAGTWSRCVAPSRRPPWRQTVRVAGNPADRVFAQTTPPPCRLRVHRDREQRRTSKVFIADGAPKGSAGVPSINVPPGQGTVMVRSRLQAGAQGSLDVEAR